MKDVKVFIPESRVAWARERMGRLARTAKKLGVKPPTFHAGEQEERLSEDGGVLRVVKGRVCTFGGEAPRLEGWRFVATLERAPNGGVLILTVPGEEAGEFYRDSDNAYLTECDYCMTRRYRKATYLLRHDASMDARVVGSTCLKDFLGHASPEAVARYARDMMDFLRGAGDEDAWEPGFGDTYELENLNEYVTRVVLCARSVKGGFVSGKRQEVMMQEGQGWVPTTAETLRNGEFPAEKANDEDRDTARAIIEWVRSMDEPENDYMHNLRTLFAEDHFPAHRDAFVASAFAAYRRANRNAAPKAEVDPGEWVGVAGETWEGNVRVAGHHDFEGTYGNTRIYDMRTVDGDHVVKWFCTGKRILKDGEVVRVKGRVKNHGSFRGVRETVLTRVRVA